MQEKEINGVFAEKQAHTYGMFDLSYGVHLGWLDLHEGPGWVFSLGPTCKFLDYSQLTAIAEFIKELNGETDEQTPGNDSSTNSI